jgi:hypothetical protein
MLMWLRDETPRRAPAPAPAAKAPAPKAVPPVKLAAPAPKRATPVRKAKATPKPQPPLVAKVIPPVEEKAPEPVPVAAVAPAPVNEPPRNEPPPGDPNSVFGWGPWTGGTPGIAHGGAPAYGGNAPPRVEGLTASLTSTSSDAPAGATPPTVVPPPQNTGSIRPGHGWGDRNHAHVHKHRR